MSVAKSVAKRMLRKIRRSSRHTHANRESLQPPHIRFGLFDCYAFLAPNEYSEHTLGLLAFLLRHNVGDINFAAIIDEVERRCLLEEPAPLESHTSHDFLSVGCRTAQDYMALLMEKRAGLPLIDASIEKCLMLNRLISFIKQNGDAFLRLVSDVRTDMRLKMSDAPSEGLVKYPEDFRKRDEDFENRRMAQEVRRLFYQTHTEAKNPVSLIHLQTRTTQQLNFLLSSQSISPDDRLTEFLDIMRRSFMITLHPHRNSIPVTIHDTKTSLAGITVTIVSLLHDFMQQHPGVIELHSIDVALQPKPIGSQFEGPRSLSWSVCELQDRPEDPSRGMLQATMSSIKIVQTQATGSTAHFAQKPYSLEFTINFSVNVPGCRPSKDQTVVLTSAPFAIGNNTVQIPRLLAGIILGDMQRFWGVAVDNIQDIAHYLVAHFTHQTGVDPPAHLTTFLGEELCKAHRARAQFSSLEERYTDFLAAFLKQVCFMAKHPLFAMLYAEGLFLGICDGDKVVATMRQAYERTVPILALRMNTIRIDYAASATASIVNRNIKPASDRIRVDVYNVRKQNVDQFTMSEKDLFQDIRSLVYSSGLPTANLLPVLSHPDRGLNGIGHHWFAAYKPYYSDRLDEFGYANSPYKPITDLFNIIQRTDQTVPNCDVNDPQANSIHPSATTQYSHASASSDTLEQNVVLLRVADFDRKIIDYIDSKPELQAQIVRKYNGFQSPSLQPSTFVEPMQVYSGTADDSVPTPTVAPHDQMFHEVFDESDPLEQPISPSLANLLQSEMPYFGE